MNLHIGPIVSSLLRNRAGSLLVVLQVAIALAVLANAAWIVHQRMVIVNRSTGFDDGNIVVISSIPANDRFNYDTAVREDLAYLRALPGVVAASLADAVPFSGTGFSTDVWTNRDRKGKAESLNALSMDEQGLKALGGRLLTGREFRADEIAPPLTPHNLTDFVPELIVTQALADAVYPGDNALGKVLYDSAGKPAVIIGVMANIIGSATLGLQKDDEVALFPRMPQADEVIYLVRTLEGRRDTVLAAAESYLGSSNRNRVITYARPLEQFKKRLYLADLNMEVFLATAVALVLFTTCLGIFGLATFNVSARSRHMGTRRALGASKGDILRYYMIENALLTTSGLVLGCVLSLASSFWLSTEYGLPRLDVWYLFGSLPLLWIIGQFSVWYPAHKASAISPSAAARGTHA